MSLLSKITWTNKTNPVTVIDRTKQATAEDFLETKTVVNAIVDAVNYIKANEVTLVSGVNHVLFNDAYPTGVPFCIIVHNCYNSDGYLVGHSITNKTKDGFDVTIGEAANLVYLTVPQR